MSGFIKDYNKTVFDETKNIKNGNNADNQIRQLTIAIGGYSFRVQTTLNRYTNLVKGRLLTETRRTMTYSCPELGLENVPVHQSLLRNAIEDIVQNVITGEYFAEQAEAAERNIEYTQSQLKQLLLRDGKPFEYENELEQAREDYRKYSELMKKEMAEKEAKYAEIDASIETADNISAIDEEEDDDDIRFAVRTDRDGNFIGDGSYHVSYDVMEFAEYPQITSRVSKSASTESVYVTYGNPQNGASVTVRYSNHSNNAVSFGDELDGRMDREMMRARILYELGLGDREFIPSRVKSIPTRMVSKQDLADGKYEEADKTEEELYRLPVGTDISRYKNKLFKGSNELILADKILHLNVNNVRGRYVYYRNAGDKARAGYDRLRKEYDELLQNKENIPNFDEVLNDWRDRKVGVVRSLYDDIAKQYGFADDAEIIVYNGERDFEAVKRLAFEFDPLLTEKEWNDLSAGEVIAWRDYLRQSNGVQIAGTNVIAFDVSASNSDRMSFSKLNEDIIHERAHSIIDKLYKNDIENISKVDGSGQEKDWRSLRRRRTGRGDLETLRSIYDAAREYPAWQRKLAKYADESAEIQGGEVLAYTVSELASERKNYAFQRYMAGEITAEEAVATLKNRIPEVDNAVIEILETFKDGADVERMRSTNPAYRFGDYENPDPMVTDDVRPLAATANALADSLGINVNIVTNIETVPPKYRKAYGYYNIRTGQTTIILPNCNSVADVQATILHEAVGHHGLRMLLGEKFNDFLDNVWATLSEEERAKYLRRYKTADVRKAADEMVATLAQTIGQGDRPEQTYRHRGATAAGTGRSRQICLRTRPVGGIGASRRNGTAR